MINFLKKIFSFLLDVSNSETELDQDILNILYLGQVIETGK